MSGLRMTNGREKLRDGFHRWTGPFSLAKEIPVWISHTVFCFDSPAFFDTLAWFEFVFVSLVLYSFTLTLEPCALITIYISPRSSVTYQRLGFSATHLLEQLANSCPCSSFISPLTVVFRPSISSAIAVIQRTLSVGTGFRNFTSIPPVTLDVLNALASLPNVPFRSKIVPIDSSKRAVTMPPCTIPGYPLTPSPTDTSTTISVMLCDGFLATSTLGARK